MRLSSLTGLRRSTAAALAAAGLVSAAALAAPAGASAATTAPPSAHEAHLAHLHHLHHLHVLHVARLNTQARAAASEVSRSASRTTLTAAPAVQVTDTSPGGVRGMAQSMVPAGQWAAFDAIISHESSWNPRAVNASSGAYGLAQALPGSKMASAGADWRTNPATQIKWTLSYMNQRYGSPNAAWAFWQTHHWY